MSTGNCLCVTPDYCYIAGGNDTNDGSGTIKYRSDKNKKKVGVVNVSLTSPCLDFGQLK